MVAWCPWWRVCRCAPASHSLLGDPARGPRVPAVRAVLRELKECLAKRGIEVGAVVGVARPGPRERDVVRFAPAQQMRR